MKKMLMTLMVTTAITLSSTVAFAADTTSGILVADSSNTTVSSTIVSTKDTSTKISLDDRIKLSVSLQSNSLVFSTEPTDQVYDKVRIDVITNIIDSELVRTVTYNRDTGATINLNDLSDGSYKLKVFITTGRNYKARGYAFTVEVIGGIGSFKTNINYDINLKMTATERTDAYALDWYRHGTWASDPAYIKQANIITAGITDDYLKAKAIVGWVFGNMTYSYVQHPESDGSFAELFPGSSVGESGICVSFAFVTTGLLQAAGLPAKSVGGGLYTVDHEWTEVYVDNRWIFVDSTGGWFDNPVAEYSITHDLGTGIIIQDKDAWEGSLYIKKIGPTGAFQDKVLKEIKNYTLGGLVTSTYGYNANDMYSDLQCTKRWNFATDRVGSYSSNIYVKLPTISVTFDSQGGTAVKSMELKPDANGYCKIPKPANPTRTGYTFTGWVVGSPDNATVWDFKTWVFTYDDTLYATWKKITTKRK